MSTQELKLYNTLSRKTEKFEAIHAPNVGLYLCGPTVYGHAHLGHARPALTFDILLRYLTHIGYKVRYVRNLTDVGHLVNDADEGEDKIQKKARLDQLEPMEIAQFFADSYNKDMGMLNIKRPSIEPRASGHIPEQIELIENLISKGFAYEVNGSVYFDVAAYSKQYPYGELSGRIQDELIAGSSVRKLEGQDEKRGPNDFALWKNAAPEHIMRWKSPWGDGFPGWHIECSAMSGKYLGKTFDIHGGGMDLLFPHHECEIAQSKGCSGHDPVKYWVHNNVLTINGQKMAKSLDNGVLIQELFTGNHRLLEKAYSPMTLRFFYLQAHYRSTIDFSNEALQAAEKGMQRILNTIKLLPQIPVSDKSTTDISAIENRCYEAMNEDMNTPIVIAQLFEGSRIINAVNAGTETITESDKEILKRIFNTFLFEILGIIEEQDNGSEKLDDLMKLLLDLRNEAKKRKDFASSDAIRDRLSEIGFEIKDGKDGSTYSIK